MKIVIAINSFKGCMTSLEAAEAARTGALRAVPDAQVIIRPAADGGDGTLEALTDGLGGHYITLKVTGPMGNPIEARYGILPDDRTAVLEMAQAAGIALVDANALNPHIATTYGVGEMIRDALSRGCRTFLIGIGGSATTDGGTGMLQALGAEFLKSDGTQIASGIRELDRIVRIQTQNMPQELAECTFRIACDVTNPLCGPEGAVAIFGPQKGVRSDEIFLLDQKMRHFARVTAAHFGKDLSDLPGAGAAGGLGFALAAYLPDVRLQSGVSMVMDAVDMEDALRDADLCITGEGQLDAQSAMGKAPAGIAGLAKKHGVPVAAFAGSVLPDANACHSAGIDAFFPILRKPSSFKEAMDPQTAKQNLSQAAEQVCRLIRSFTQTASRN